MVRALRVVTVERGVDPRRFALMPFGGAGPMHAAAIAAELEITRLLCPRAGGVLSALGMIAAERRRDTAKTVMLRGAELGAERVAAEVEQLRRSVAEGLDDARLEVNYELRYRGQAFELAIAGPAAPDPADLAERFAEAHEARYGYRDPDGEVELVTIRLALALAAAEPRPEAARGSALTRARRRARFAGELARRRVAARRAGRRRVRSRALYLGAPRDHPRPRTGLGGRGRHGGHDRGRGSMSGLDPVTLQVLIGSLRSICDEMGAVLVRAARSANIKERRDCSTALFDAAGELVMQAEHIPVHLGSMPDVVGAVIDERAAPPATPGSSTTPSAAAPTCPTSR